MMIMALAPSLTPEEFPAVTLPIFGRKAAGSAARSDLHRDDLRREVALAGGPLGIVVAAERHRVDLLTRKIVHLGDQFGRDPHDVGLSAEELHDAPLLDRPLLQAGQEVRARMETVDYVIHEDLVLKTASPACGGNGVGDPRHVLHAAGKDDLRHACLYHRHARDDRFHAGDADPVDRYRGDGLRDPRHQSGDAGDVEGVHRLHTAAETDVVDERGIDPCSVYRLPHHDTPESGAVRIAKRTAEGADSGPAG
jgi:hypothetical protein